MDVNRERFCKKICKVVSTFAPRYNELILGDAVPHPVKAHVDALSAFRLDGVQSDAYSALVVAEDCSWALRVPERVKNLAWPYFFLTSKE